MRKLFIVLLGVLNAALGSLSKPQLTTLPVLKYGHDTAPIEIIEFCSMYCPACDHFKQATLPIIEKQYIESNHVRWIRIPFAIDFGDVLMLAYMKQLPSDSRLEADTWYNAFRDNASFECEDEFHEKLIAGMKERFPKYHHIQRARPEDIDSIIQETFRLVEHYKLKDYPNFLLDGKVVSISKIKEEIDHTLKKRQR